MLVAGTLVQDSGSLGSTPALLDSLHLSLDASFHTSKAGIIALLHLLSALGGLMD